MKKLFITVLIVISFLSTASFCLADATIYFNPASGKVGSEVTISSNDDISGADYILFNKTKVIPSTTDSENYIVVNVPSGATTGKITVVGTTNNGDIVSATNFTVESASKTTSTASSSSSGSSSSSSDNYTVSNVKFKGLVPVCTGKDSNGNYTNNCGFNMFMILVNKFINYVLVALVTPLFALIMVYVGILYLTAGGNPGNIEKAKKILKNAIFGYIIALAAWLIVKTILTTLGYIDINKWF